MGVAVAALDAFCKKPCYRGMYYSICGYSLLGVLHHVGFRVYSHYLRADSNLAEQALYSGNLGSGCFVGIIFGAAGSTGRLLRISDCLLPLQSCGKSTGNICEQLQAATSVGMGRRLRRQDDRESARPTTHSHIARGIRPSRSLDGIAGLATYGFLPRHSRLRLQHSCLRLVASQWYPGGANEGTPINQIEQAEESLVQRLIGGEPRAMVVAGRSDLSALAADQTLALNKVTQQIGLRRKLRRLVRDAIYGIGICRIGMTHDRDVPIREIAPDLDEEAEDKVGIGRMMVEVVSFESWVHDCQADTLEEKEFCGHAYWVDEDDLGYYLPGVKKSDLVDEEKRWIDEHGDEMAGAISRGTDGAAQLGSYGKKYWLWDIWLPRKNTIVTMPVNGTGDVAYVRKWNSRPGGPYLFLQYREIPDQAMPKSVLADLSLVHDSLNSTFRKVIDQTREQKTVLGFKPGHEDDAQRILDVGNRGCVQMRDPSAVQEFKFNGPDQALLATLLQERELASIIGGNTDSLSGLASQSPTLGQEEIVGQNASVKVQAMEIETAEFVREAFEAMRWYLYHEQMEPVPFVKEVRGTDIRIPGEWSAIKASASAGRYDAYEIRIEPSLAYRSSKQRLQDLIGLWQNVIMPALQTGMLKQVPDMDRLMEIIAQYSNLPELKTILRFATPEEQQSMGGQEMPRQSPVTTRNYVRRGSPGPTRSGMAMQALQMMGSGNQQNAGG